LKKSGRARAGSTRRSNLSNPSNRSYSSDGADGWDDYAPFYDWENARTHGRRDVAFWRRLVTREQAPVLELGCGTGRLLLPLARTGVAVTGVDRSSPMLAHAIARARKLPRARRPSMALGDIRALPFASRAFGVVIAPYGMVQSVIADRDLDRTLGEIHRVLDRGGLVGIDLVPDLAVWPPSPPHVALRGRGAPGTTIELRESVRQDPRRGLTVFDDTFVVRRRGRRALTRRFTLTFRTRPMREMLRRLDAAGFDVEAVLGDYRGGPWDTRADVWVILARKRS
jgi:SAM-dependent methyltransferase